MSRKQAASCHQERSKEEWQRKDGGRVAFAIAIVVLWWAVQVGWAAIKLMPTPQPQVTSDRRNWHCKDEPVSRVKLMRLVASCPESAGDLAEMPTVVPVTHEGDESDCPICMVAFAD